MLLALGAAALLPLPAATVHAENSATALSPAAALREEIADRARGDQRDFYETRDNRPLWIDASGAISPAARMLLTQIESAELDGLKPGKLKARSLEKALDRAAEGTPQALARAELAISRSYALYVRELRGARHAPMIYESDALAPVKPTTTAALRMAAAADSLSDYVSAMGWMHPLYAPMRKALRDPRYSRAERYRIARNLDRIRALPASPSARYVLVDTAAARLWMYEDGKPVDSMRVVVGKAANPTPMMAGFIRYAIVNPYWNVPPDLVQHTIANNVLDRGAGYLKSGGYQVLSDWSRTPAVVDPSLVDWHAVAAGTLPPPRVRQLPGGRNFMGKVKFMFPNEQGIYLHDTPDKDLLRKDARQLSSGCVRLEDAARLGRWLLGEPLPRKARTPEQHIALPEVVPVYITYLTALPGKKGISFRNDVYSRDRPGSKEGQDKQLARADRP
jgi:murein L,D-transpeptidase YcbB/YkuD